MRGVRRRTLSLLAVTATLVLGLSACGSDGGGSNGGSGGHITVVKAIPSGSLDAALLSSITYGGATAGNAIYDQLLWYTPDGELKYGLAEDLSTTDGTTWTLKLRPGITFSDGTAFTTEAVKFSWERLLDPTLGSQAIGAASQIAKIEIVSDLEATITLASVNRKFPALIDAQGALNWIVPTSAGKDPKAFGLDPVGAGPFTVKRFGTDDTLELVKNADYWQEGLPRLDAITVITSSDAAATADMMATGDADVRVDILQEGTDEVKDAGGSVLSVPFQGGVTLNFNMARAPFDDIRARQAIVNAIDPEFYNEAVHNGTEKAVTTLVTDNQASYDPDLVQVHDSDRAQELFDELAADGKPLKFEFLANTTTSSQGLSQILTAILGKYDNVSVSIKNVDLVTYGGMVGKRDFDAAILAAYGGDPDTAFFEPFREGGQTNLGGWVDDEATQALVTGRTTEDEAAAADAYRTVQERILAEAPALFLIRSGAVLSMAENVSGVEVTAGGLPIFTRATVD